MTFLKDVSHTGLSKAAESRAARGDGDAAAAGRNKLVLASASTRRIALLEQVGIVIDELRPVSIDERPKKGEMPRTVVNRLAEAKARAAQEIVRGEPGLANAFILAADTIVAVGRRVLVKPETMEEAAASLKLLSGRNHKVMTTMCLVTPGDVVRRKLVETRVRFKRLGAEEINTYLSTGEWRGKAGGYAIQGLAGAFVMKISGSYTNVVGLPVAQLVNILRGEGFPVYFHWLARAELGNTG